jgi:hypothetical protein
MAPTPNEATLTLVRHASAAAKEMDLEFAASLFLKCPCCEETPAVAVVIAEDPVAAATVLRMLLTQVEAGGAGSVGKPN